MENISTPNFFEMARQRRELQRDTELQPQNININADFAKISDDIGKALIGKIVEVIDPSAMPYGRLVEKSRDDPIQQFYPLNVANRHEYGPARWRTHSHSKKTFAPSFGVYLYRLDKIKGEVVGEDPDTHSIVIRRYNRLRKFGLIDRVLSYSTAERLWVQLIDKEGRQLVHIKDISE